MASPSTVRTRSSAATTSSMTTSTTTAHKIGRPDVAQDPMEHAAIHSIRPSEPIASQEDAASVADSTDGLLESPADQGPLCTWADLPHWMQDNPAIWTGYRRPTFSYRKCLASLGFLHNESVNIWTHLLGAVGCIVVSPIAYFKIFGVLETIQWTDIAVFYIFMASAVICLFMSASFHCFSCHSDKVSHQWNRCDYVGIAVLIVGSFYPAIFYGFYCFRTLQILYISIITLFGLGTIIAVTQPHFRTPKYRWIRSVLFLALGLSGIFPVVHGLFLYGFHLAVKAIAFDHLICMGASYVIGALLYAGRVPERFFPGKLDHFGASHQIFHVCVLIGVTTHFLGVSEAMAFWHDSNHSCAIPIADMRIAFTQ
ncbi:hypothetical protein BGZ67_001093 [Mortierella alpina]|nr:hypothetical protein BGZ67_001093 [Mortierella alpina]